MKEELVSFEVAKLAKETGFNEICNNHIAPSLREITDNGSRNTDWEEVRLRPNAGENNDPLYTRPTQFLLQKWLREVHNLDIIIGVYYGKGKTQYQGELYNEEDIIIENGIRVINYEKALEYILLIALNKII